MFESITSGLGAALDRLVARGRLTDTNIDEGLREVRKALLEADVNYKVVEGFIERVRAKAIGQQQIRGVNPGHQIVKVVHDELVELMGPVETRLKMNPKGPTVVMMVGLQGSGKTTTCGKLAALLKRKGNKPLLVAADVQRPAAIDQLQVLGEQLELPVYSEKPGWLRGKPTGICQRGVKEAEKQHCDIVILDTAGRLHIDAELMAELCDIKDKVRPQNVFLVCDAMTGQDAVQSASQFNEQLAIDGVVLTKLDGDARGGAALSIKAVTGKTIRYIGVGEKLDKLEEFRPESMASRILGMGDIITLVEKAQETIDQDQAQRSADRLMSGRWNFEDFLEQLKNLKKMGSFKDLLGMIPGFGKMIPAGVSIDDDELKPIEAIICSMNKHERKDPEVLNGSRRRRIADGSGTTVADVNGLIKQFKNMQRMMHGLSKGGLGGLMRGLPGMSGLPGLGAKGPLPQGLAGKFGKFGKPGRPGKAPRRFKMR